MRDWKAVGIVTEGKPIDVGGINPWDHIESAIAQGTVKLPHPQCPNHLHAMTVYSGESGNQTVTFAVDELSAGVYGFYVLVGG